MTRPQYIGDPLTHATLARRRDEVQARHKRALTQVNEFYTQQQSLSTELGSGLQSLRGHGEELTKIAEEESSTGLWASISRTFSARRTILARRSVAEALLAQYEDVSTRLREATAFSDELKLCALELQDEVDRLHRDRAASTHNYELASAQLLDLEAERRRLEAEATNPERDRRLDQVQFQLRAEEVARDLFKASAEQCGFHLGPARTLRDTVLELHEDMAKYVLSATHTVNAAGRRIQGLGMMADAPVVVSELQASIEELNSAMEATALYVEQSQQVIAQVLPELARRLESEAAIDAYETKLTLDEVSRERAEQTANAELRVAAREEIENFLRED